MVNEKSARLGGMIVLSWFLIVLSIISYFLLMDVPWIRSTAGPVWVALALAVSIAAFCWAHDSRVRTRFGAGAILAFAAFAVWAFFVAARLPKVNALTIGQPSPQAVFVGPEGQEISIAEALESGPLLLVFYRGHW